MKAAILKEVIYILMFLVSLAAAFVAGRKTATPPPATPPAEVVKVERVHLRDTVEVRRDFVEVRRDTVTDTVEVPIYLHHFDTVVEGVKVSGSVSGFHSSIDTLEVTTPKATETPWSLGVSAGIAATPAGVQPFIGAGITYNLLKL